MKEISATEAADALSEMLDVEHRRQSFVIVRGGHPIAKLEPVATLNGRALKGLLDEQKPDNAWLQDLSEMREALAVDRSWRV